MNNTFPESWTLLPIEKCMSEIIDYRGKSPNKTTSGIPLVTAKVVKGGCIEKLDEFISEDDYDEWMCRGLPKPGDVVLTTEAPLGEVAQLDDRKVALAQRLITLRGKSDILDNTFLKFLFQDEFVQEQLHSRATGTTVLGIRQSELRKIILPIPPLPEQRSIAHILGTLDNKIELNRQMNETLESMARAIFKSWFVDFDPVRAKAEGRNTGLPKEIADLFPDSFEETELGEVPEGWKFCRLSELCNKISKGTTPTKKDIDSARDELNVPFIKVKNINESGEINLNSMEKIPLSIHTGILKRSILEEGDILFSIAGTIGRVAIVEKDLANSNTNQAIAFVRLKSKVEHFGLCLMHLKSDRISRDAEAAIVQGVQANVSLSSLGSFNILLPKPEILKLWNRLFMSLYDKQRIVATESLTLSNLRDNLLPKLMLGQICVER